MGDLIDSIFNKRRCSLTDSKDRDRSEHDSDVIILEIGARKTVDTYRCRTANELKDYVDRVNEHSRNSIWGEPSRVKPSSLRLFFLPPLQDGHAGVTPYARALPGVTEILHENVGLSHMFMDEYSEADEDSVSPSSSPRLSALATRSRRARFGLDGLDEDSLMPIQPEQEEPTRSWIWETRYTKSTTQTMADADTTTYFCMNFPQRLQNRIADTIHSLEALAKNPLFMDTLIVDEMIAFYRDAIKFHRGQLLAVQNDDETNSTDMSIQLEELAGHWRTILKDIQSIQTHIQHLQSVADARNRQKRHRARTPPPPFPSGDYQHRRHTRQKSSEAFGPPAGEVLQLQKSTCEFWARCVNMYLERTASRIDRTSTTYRLRKTIPLRRRGSLPQLNRKLSNLTVEVAVQIQRNSSSVSTMALSFLSTIFFSPDGLIFAITYWWWILVTLVVPLTFIILHLWFETLASNTAFVRRRKAQRLGGVAEEGSEEKLES